MWIPIPKPSESSVVASVAIIHNHAEPFGLLAAITSVYSHIHGSSIIGSSIISGWSDTPKPINSVWSLVTKPTT